MNCYNLVAFRLIYHVETLNTTMFRYGFCPLAPLLMTYLAFPEALLRHLLDSILRRLRKVLPRKRRNGPDRHPPEGLFGPTENPTYERHVNPP